jgi:tetratricopeptide (TPR) repeat protein
MRRRRPGSRSTRYKRRLPDVVGWSLAALAGLAALIAVAYLHGNEPAKKEDLVTSLHTTLAEPAVAALAAFAAVLLTAWGVRHLIFEFLAWWPGRVIAEEFVAGPEVEGADAHRLTTEFRDRLAYSHLQAPATVPAPAQQGDFLDVLSNGGVDTGNPLGVVLSLLRAAKPDHAYEVKGALVSRATPPRCGVTVHVVRLPGKTAPGETFWGPTWEDAIRRAADHATASILPRTRRSRSPWSGWRGFHLPSRLFHNYERAAELERARRYDEALELYFKALEDDPTNLGLRLQIGFLQEKLALFLDALDTYQSILDVAGGRPVGHAVTRRAQRDVLRRSYRLPARRDRDQVLLVARYRRAILLGGEQLPRQWAIDQGGARESARDAERRELRKRLRPALTDLFRQAEASSTVAWLSGREPRGGQLRMPVGMRMLARIRNQTAASPDGDDLAKVLAQPELKPTKALRRRLEELLLRASLHELSQLRRDLPPLLSGHGIALTRRAVDLAGLWMQVRLAGLASDRYPDPMLLVESIENLEGRLGGFKRWEEHYNAACIYSLPLLARTSRMDPQEVRALSHRAVERLESAIACADSGYIASRRDWLISDDPDLDGLRAQPAFKTFEAKYFPAAARTPRRPRDLHKWEVSRYTFRLLAATADRWKEAWRGRGSAVKAGLDASELAAWLRVERAAWNRVRSVAINHRHWQSRVALVDDMRKWSMAFGFEPLQVRFPRFTVEDAALLYDDEAHAPDVSSIVEAGEDRLQAVAGTIEHVDGQSGCCKLVADLDRWHTELTRLDGAAPQLDPGAAALLCDSHASLWEALDTYLESDDECLDGKLAQAIEETEKIWITVRRELRSRPAAGGRNGSSARAGRVPLG